MKLTAIKHGLLIAPTGYSPLLSCRLSIAVKISVGLREWINMQFPQRIDSVQRIGDVICNQTIHEESMPAYASMNKSLDALNHGR